MERGNGAQRSNSRRLARRVSAANQPDAVGPDARGKTFWLLLGQLPKVTRRKGGTVSREQHQSGVCTQNQRKNAQPIFTQANSAFPETPSHGISFS